MARTHSLDLTCRTQIEQDAANATAAGVRSVPHFVFDNRFAINGGGSEDEIAAAINHILRLSVHGD